jgi:hypothetical protein
MHADSSINNWCSAGIHYENLPENFETTFDWIVYSFNKVTQVSCITSKKAFTRYAIALKIVANDTVKLETISDYVADYLSSNSYNNIHDIVFTGDNHTLDLEKNIYMNTLSFDALYV